MRTSDPCAHQAAITAVALIATALALHAAVRAPSGAQHRPGGRRRAVDRRLGRRHAAVRARRLRHYPTVAEWFYLASYPAFWAAVMLLMPRWGAGHWLDGIVACLGVAAAGAALLMPG